jgi:hypothetical protein
VTGGADGDPALIRITKGAPTAEELSALLAVLLAGAGQGDRAAGEPGSRTRVIRLPRAPWRSPGSWAADVPRWDGAGW